MRKAKPLPSAIQSLRRAWLDLRLQSNANADVIRPADRIEHRGIGARLRAAHEYGILVSEIRNAGTSLEFLGHVITADEIEQLKKNGAT